MPKPAIIVVSSLVARGSVGSRATAFVLERLGFPVWLVPTVLLPWHPGHGRSTRLALDGKSFASLVADLAGAPWLGEVGGVLTGYFGSEGQIEPVAGLIAAVKARNPQAVFLCDPIIGDGDRLFQPEALAAALRDRLLPFADIATPNRFELAWLTGASARDNAGLVAAARRLGPRELVVTSAFAGEGDIGNLIVAPHGVHLASHRRLDGVPHGTGDLLAALHLAHRLSGLSSAEALHRAVGSTLRVIDAAITAGADEMPLAEAQDALLAGSDGVTLRRL